MTRTEHLQKVLLAIAKDIDKLCRENDIEYYLLGGTAIGAVRHKGFIPWDDDFDIVLLPGHYDRFIKVCKEKLDKNKYIVQEGLVDWPEQFSKIRLKGTHIKEKGDYYSDSETDGIYVDVFRMDHAAKSKTGRLWQFLMGKLWLSYNLTRRDYHAKGFIRKVICFVSGALSLNLIHRFVVGQYLKYNDKPSDYLCDIMGRASFSKAFVPKSYFGKPTDIQFEDSYFLAQQDIDKYLTHIFGDYMTLPPIEKRVGLHIESIDFGKY